MKILYKQPSTFDNSLLAEENFLNTYIKKISIKNDSLSYASKEHHHTCFEIHIIFKGFQSYEINNKIYRIECGNFLIIPPQNKHRLIDFSDINEKFSITFITENPKITQNVKECSLIKTPNRIIENLRYIESEFNKKLEFTKKLIDNCAFESIITILRLSGFSEDAAVSISTDNARLSLAKQFIKDNIEFTPTVADIAEYCNISTKQLTRLFKRENITPLSYIQQQKIGVIQKYLSEDSLTLKEIAEKFNFNNEYYFNSYFKKYAGMPPGEYRSMHIQK